MKSRYLAGFIAPVTKKYFPNILTDHRGNAEKIIKERGWYVDWQNDNVMHRDSIDFLIFRKRFIQIGSCNDKKIIASNYYDLLQIKKIIYSTDFEDKQYLEELLKYTIILIMPPKF